MRGRNTRVDRPLLGTPRVAYRGSFREEAQSAWIDSHAAPRHHATARDCPSAYQCHYRHNLCETGSAPVGQPPEQRLYATDNLSTAYARYAMCLAAQLVRVLLQTNVPPHPCSILEYSSLCGR